MTPRVSPTESIRAEIDDLFLAAGEVGSLEDTLDQAVRLGARLVLQAALEAEVTEFLARNRYERRKAAKDARAGARNGYGDLTVKTPSGPVALKRPKLRGTAETFTSRLLGKGVSRTNALESLVIAGFIRGLSVRDVEATLAEALGPDATISKSTVSTICSAIKDEFDAFAHRSLCDVELEYLFLDGSHFKYHDSAKAEPVLVAWGISTTGKPVLLHIAAGSSESTIAWEGFLNDMVARGLRAPTLIISDGAPGLTGAADIVFSSSLRQRCLIHRCRNIIAKVPQHAQGEVKADFWAIFNDIDAAPGAGAIAEATRRAKRFANKWGKLFPAAVACLEEDFDHLTTYLNFPTEHWKRIRHSNFIERTFGETRRRVKVIGRLPGDSGEQSCLSLVWAVLDRASKGWRGVEMTPAIVRRLQKLRYEHIGIERIEQREEVEEQADTAAA